MSMDRLTRQAAVVALLLGLAWVSSAAAQVAPPAVPAPVPTVWDKLGIPQGLSALHNNLLNTKGNHPCLEAKPGLKALADPANLQPNMPPAIQAAAKIKQEEDLAPQKIKAIKYLATVGCNCYQKTVDVRGALVAALDDCTEEVRYQAALALCQAAGSCCQQCGGTCCTAASMNKLQDVAQGTDAQGCFKEPSARVRQMAQAALEACRRKTGPTSSSALPEPAKAPSEEPGAAPLPAGERPVGVPTAPLPTPAPKKEAAK